MNRLLRTLGLGAALLLLLSASALAQGRIGTVDMKKVFDTYWKTKQADDALKSSANELEKDFKSMVSEYEKAKEEYGKLRDGANDQSLSPEEREKRKKSAEDKLKQLNDTER